MNQLLQSLHEQVTHRVICSLEQGQKPWVYVGDHKARVLPYNLVTNEDYSSINTIVLWLAAQDQHYAEYGWLTLKQATRAGYRIIKGEKGIKCFSFKLDSFKDEETGEMIQVPIQTTFVAFNISQLSAKRSESTSVDREGTEERTEEINGSKKMTPIEQCKALIQAASANIRRDQHIQQTEYVLSEDVICVPCETDLKVQDHDYVNILYGLVRWTGHDSRLNRLAKINGPVDVKETFEALVADIGTGFLCAKFGLKGKWRVADCLKDRWLDLLRSDPQVIFRAASLANKAYKYLMCLKQNAVLDPESESTDDHSDDSVESSCDAVADR